MNNIQLFFIPEISIDYWYIWTFVLPRDTWQYLINTYKEKLIMKCEYDDQYAFNRNFREQGVLENIDMTNSIKFFDLNKVVNRYELPKQVMQYA